MSQSDYILRKKKLLMKTIPCVEACEVYGLSQPYSDVTNQIETYNNNPYDNIKNSQYYDDKMTQSDYLLRKKACFTSNELTKGSQQYSRNKSYKVEISIKENEKPYSESTNVGYIKTCNERILDEYNLCDNLCNGDYIKRDFVSNLSLMSQSDYLIYKRTSIILEGTIENYEKLNLQMISLYKNVASDINTLLEASINGNLEYVKNNLSTEKYLGYSKLLADERCKRFPSYENIRKIINNILAVLKSSVSLEDDLRNQISELQKQVNIMTLPEENTVFNVSQQVNIVAEIKPEYLEYVRLYGMPQGAAFDPDKLADVISRLSEETSTENNSTTLSDTISNCND